MRARLSGDRGGVTTELVLVTPILLVLLMFIVFAGRMATAKGRVINASRDAARAASIERSAGAAQHEAVAADEATLAEKSVTSRPLQRDVDPASCGARGAVRSAVGRVGRGRVHQSRARG